MDYHYQDFMLELVQLEEGQLQVRAHTDAFGQGAAREVWQLPFDEQTLTERLKSYSHQMDLIRKGCEPFQDRLAELQKEQVDLGTKLYRVLGSGEIETVFQRCLGRLSKSEGLRIQIAWDPSCAHLNLPAALPWEMICEPDFRRGGVDFLARRRRFPISRYLMGLVPMDPFEVQGDLRVLLVASQPADLPNIDVETEQRVIREALEPVSGVQIIESRPILEVIRDRIIGDGIHVLHFMGHGDFEPSTGESTLFFTNERGAASSCPADSFADSLKDLPSLRLVVLSSCLSAALPRHAAQDPFLTVAPALARQAEIPAVVAMQFPLSDAAAVAFSKRFYTKLSDGVPVDVAASEGRLAIDKFSAPKVVRMEWPLPVVFMRDSKGQILTRRPRLEPAVALENFSGYGMADSRDYDPMRTVKIGVRSVLPKAPGMERRVKRLLDLAPILAQGRGEQIETWNHQILPQLETYLIPWTRENRPLELELAVHWSLAFASGFFLRNKSGHDLRLLKRSLTGAEIWSAQDGPIPKGSLWDVGERQLAEGQPDVAIAVSVDRLIDDEVDLFLEGAAQPTVGRLILASLYPVPAPNRIETGTHALRLAQTLTQVIERRSPFERSGKLHLFVSAPSVFSFFLGQRAESFGEIQLYERRRRPSRPSETFIPSITLPKVVP